MKHLDVQVGDYVKAGQLLGEMEPVDMEARLLAQEAALKRAQAQLRESRTREAYARSQPLATRSCWQPYGQRRAGG